MLRILRARGTWCYDLAGIGLQLLHLGGKLHLGLHILDTISQKLETYRDIRAGLWTTYTRITLQMDAYGCIKG